MGLVDFVNRVRFERRAAGEEVEEGTSEAVDVSPNVGVRSIEDLLGRNEIGRAEGLPFVSQRLSIFSSRVALASPKSKTLTMTLPPCFENMRLPGLMSR